MQPTITTTTNFTKYSDTAIQREDDVNTKTVIEVSTIQATLNAAVQAKTDRDNLYLAQKSELDTNHANDSVRLQKAIDDAQANLNSANALITQS